MIEAAGPSPAIARCLEWWALPRFRRLRALRLRGFAASAASRLLRGAAASRLPRLRGFSGALRLRGFRGFRGFAASPGRCSFSGFSWVSRLRGFVASPRWPGPVYPCIVRLDVPKKKRGCGSILMFCAFYAHHIF